MPAKSKAQQRLMGLAYGNPKVRNEIGISKKDARKFAKTKHDNLPEKVHEAMNFTEYLEAVEGVEPVYQVEGELPKCPPGYKYNAKNKRCEPKSKEDEVGKDQKDSSPANSASYKVWGRTGLNGDGYAWEDKGGDWGPEGGAGMGASNY